MSSTKGPAKGSRILNGRYYLVRADGKRRIWVGLTKVEEGLPAFYAALAEQHRAPTVADDLMPRVIAAWEAEIMAKHAETTQRDERARGRVIAERLDEFRARDLEPHHVAAFLADYARTPKTFNLYRAQIGELMRFAMLKGWRQVGTDPVRGIIQTMATPPRHRYITDSELRRIKVAAMRGKDGHDTRSGPMVCALIDMAYLTGQRIGDLLALEWKHFGADGIRFVTAKTGAAVTITWTPKLRDVVRRLKALKLRRPGASDFIFVQKAGQPYTYWGASTAWRRACARAGIDAHFHDIRAKAITDKESREGMQGARRMGGHTTEGQTADYVRNRQAIRTGATR